MKIDLTIEEWIRVIELMEYENFGWNWVKENQEIIRKIKDEMDKRETK
jgi:hypothetical protein